MSELTMSQLLQGLQQAVAEADQTVRRAQEPHGDCVGAQPQMAIDDVTFTVAFVTHQVTPPPQSAESALSAAGTGGDQVRVTVDQQALADAEHVNTLSLTVRNRPVERLEINGRRHIVPAGVTGEQR